MLTEKQIGEIREHLERAQNPLFYYDNDADGLCSFLILRRFLGRGKGVAIRSYPGLDAGYARKASELNADYVFILDKPVLSREFVEEISNLGIPIVWIDHHEVEGEDFERDFKNFFTYNPTMNPGKDKSEEPVTYLCYKITGRKEDLWLAMIGCIADRFMPDFIDEFRERYRDYWGRVEEPFDAYYGTEIGRIAMALNFGLKDSVTHVVQMQNFLISSLGPEDVFSEVNSNRSFRNKYYEIRKKYDLLLEKAKNKIIGNLIFFDYSGDLSISGDLSNELSYVYPGKYIAVAYRSGGVSNVSLRGKNVRRILEGVLGKFEGASGGGHEDAVGARIKTEDLEKFKESLIKEIN